MVPYGYILSMNLLDIIKYYKKAVEVKNDASSKYGYVYDGWSHLSCGHCYTFDNINSSNAYNGIISIYVGDRSIDIECASNADIKSILYLANNNRTIPIGKETYIINDLLEVIKKV